MQSSDLLGLSNTLPSFSISLATVCLCCSDVPNGIDNAVTGDASFPNVGSLSKGERDLWLLCGIPEPLNALRWWSRRKQGLLLLLLISGGILVSCVVGEQVFQILRASQG
jgi:hypothetical protein